MALSGIVGEGRIPKKIMGILQGEALMNDASGLVSLKFAVAVAMGTMVFTVGGATVEFLKVAIGGVLAGFVVSWSYGRSMRFLSRWGGDEPATQIVLLFLLPFASYLIAEHIGVSGILAAVAAGMTITRSGVMRTAPWPCACAPTAPGQCWSLSSTAWSSCCWACNCRISSPVRWWRRRPTPTLRPGCCLLTLS
ncbi:Putative Na(+)/H(+) exchanger protein, CPA1 family precursor [Klebsiella pneumoniae IS46]|nr:Putative Na(+)/H(+) exchanger protein, CPA1 family precursor [Klebsiella pneumoniae IS46]